MVSRIPAAAALRLFVGVLALSCASLPVRAAEPAPPQAEGAQAKARLATTLVRFAQWPAGSFADDRAPLHLCIVHDSADVAAAFAAHDGAHLAGRRTAIVSNPDVRSYGCHVVFIDDSAARSSEGLVAALAEAPILTIGAVDGFLAGGGMVELVDVDGSLRFDVDLPALRRAGMAVGPGVLKLARRVQP